jgi:O-antigen/teichoic acid export membrane protein
MLLISNVILAGLGFVFWVIAARLFTKQDIGIASVIIGATSLITSVGLLGLDSGLMRFLGSSANPRLQLESTCALVCVSTTVVGIAYIALAPALSPRLDFIRSDLVDSILLIAFLLINVINTLLQATFISKRRAALVLVGNSVFSVFKVALLPFLTVFGVMGIISASWMALLVSITLCIVLLRRKFGLWLRPVYHPGSLGNVRKFATTLFATGIENNLIQAAIPLVVLNRLGAAKAADYYIVLGVASILGMVPVTTFQALLAEGGSSIDALAINVHRSSKHVFILLLPAVVVMLAVGRYILLLFGQSYSDQGTSMLQLFALAVPFSAINYLADGVANIRQRNRLFLMMNSLNSGMVLLFSYLLVGEGLTGLGIAWLVAQILTVVVYATILRHDIPDFIRPRMKRNPAIKTSEG